MSYRGVVTGSGIGWANNRPYVEVQDGNENIKCEYVSGGPPPRGTWVEVTGKAVVLDPGLTILRPCVLLRER